MKQIASALLGTLLTLTAAAQVKPDVALRAAMETETVKGDLKGAIEQYKKIAQAGDRASAAKALVHMAECYQKLGDAESRKIYERVVREYADQKESAAIAHARLGGTAQHTGIITRQVWTGPKVDGTGAVSPDGRLLSFTDRSNGDLALHDFATGQDRRLTNKGTWFDSFEYAAGSVISPDGKQVAYGWTTYEKPGKDPFFELRLIDMNGGKPRVLIANHHDVQWINVMDWSPDGKWLAVRLWRADRTAQHVLVSTADGTLRVLKSVALGSSKIAFSPDGKYLAYDLPVGGDSQQRDIYLMAIDGSRDTPAVVTLANDRVLGWSPDGNHLLFVSDRGGSNGVWAQSIRDGKPQGGLEVAKLVKADLNPWPRGLTRSGALYYSVSVSGMGFYVSSVDFETGKVLSPPKTITQQYAGVNVSPQWSPDGKYLAYLSGRSTGTVLVIQSMETGKVSELKPELVSFNTKLWSPDGSFFVVAGADKSGRHGIFRLDRQSGAVTPFLLTEPGQVNAIPLGWSPDGRTLYISRKFVVFARDMQSGTEREVVRRSDVIAFAVSPGGRLLAATTAGESGKPAALLVVPAEGGEPRELLRVSDAEALGGFLAWSPDGKFLHFRKFPKGAPIGERQPWRIAVEGGAPRRLDLQDALGGSPSVHPDGHQVASTMSERANVEVWVMENFLPKLSAVK